MTHRTFTIALSIKNDQHLIKYLDENKANGVATAFILRKALNHYLDTKKPQLPNV